MLVEKASTASASLKRREAAAERAVSAWREFSGGSPAPPRVDFLKRPRRRGKSVVLELGGVGPGGMSVVAKELLDDACHTELVVYRNVLPALSVGGPELFGSIASSRPGRTWLFLEAVTGTPFDKANPAHVAIASGWLATFHAESATRGLCDALPRREVDHYLSLASSALISLGEVASNPALNRDQVDVLSSISSLLEKLLGSSEGLKAIYASLPVSLAHGDFKGNNMAFAVASGEEGLKVFDWSESHRGPMAVDLFSIDGAIYRTALNEMGLDEIPGTTERWVLFGSLLRWILAISWEIPRLRFDWVEGPMRNMFLYEIRLRTALERSSWIL